MSKTVLPPLPPDGEGEEWEIYQYRVLDFATALAGRDITDVDRARQIIKDSGVPGANAWVRWRGEPVDEAQVDEAQVDEAPAPTGPLGRLYRAVEYMRDMRPRPSGTAAHVLVAVAARSGDGGCWGVKLAADTGRDKANISRALAYLEANGAIKRDGRHQLPSGQFTPVYRLTEGLSDSPTLEAEGLSDSPTQGLSDSPNRKRREIEN